MMSIIFLITEAEKSRVNKLRAQTISLQESPSVFKTTVENEVLRPHNFIMLPKNNDLLHSLVTGKHYYLAFHRQKGLEKAKQMTCQACPEDHYVNGIVRAITAKNKSTRQCTCSPYIWRCEPCYWWHITTPEVQR